MPKESTKNFWKMQGEGAKGVLRLLNMIHGYIYYTLYDHYVVAALAILRFLAHRLPNFWLTRIAYIYLYERYHCKVISYENARRLVTLEEEVIVPYEESIKIIPFEIANKLIFKHKDQLAIVDCPCRMEKKTAGEKWCEPINTCIFLGKVGVDFVTSHMPRMHGHRATKEEVLEVLEEQNNHGVAFTLWFKDATGYRGGVLCCCCSCCCGGVEAERMARGLPGMKPIKLTAPSGYSALVDVDKCKACGRCVAVCPYDAREIVRSNGEMRLKHSEDLCMGCGACVSICPNGASSLEPNPEKGEVFDVKTIREVARKAASSV